MIKLVSLSLALALSSPSIALAQQTQPTRPRSVGLVIAGLFVVGGGIGLASAPGTTYRVLDADYCVTTYAVDDGRCSVSAQRKKIGAAVAGAGVAMIIIGAQRVTVAPTPTGVGAMATVRW